MEARERKQHFGDQAAPVKTVLPINTNAYKTIDLVELFYRLMDKIKWIAAAALIGALLAAAITIFAITPKYTATSKLYVLNSNDSAINLSDIQIGTYLAEDYKEVFKIWHVHEMVIEKLGLSYNYTQLSDMLTVSNPSDTRILYITVISEDPDEAKMIADTYAEVVKEFIAKAMETEEPNVIEEALRPSAPSSPSTSRNILRGFLLGLILSCGLITVQFLMDDRLRNSEDISKYIGLPTLGMIPRITQYDEGKEQRSSVRRRK